MNLILIDHILEHILKYFITNRSYFKIPVDDMFIQTEIKIMFLKSSGHKPYALLCEWIIVCYDKS